MTSNRIDRLFEKKSSGVLSIYITAGFPRLDDTVKVIEALEASGVDMVEVGMPFSDPLADGPIIQESSQIALSNGISMELLFRQLSGIREKVDIPLVWMGYLNPVLQYGVDRFLKSCSDAGIDGVIIPDLPLSEFREGYREKFCESGISFSMLITPQTSTERTCEIAEASSGFLYMVADSSTTGVKEGIRQAQVEYFERISAMKLGIPRMIGFGISSNETFRTACQHAHGAIIGSAFISAVKDAGENELEERIREFVQHRILGLRS